MKKLALALIVPMFAIAIAHAEGTAPAAGTTAPGEKTAQAPAADAKAPAKKMKKKKHNKEEKEEKTQENKG